MAWGPVEPLGWQGKARHVDFYDIKADVEQLLAPRKAEFVAAEHPALHPGRSARVVLDGVDIGHVGELHPRWRQAWELSSAPVVFELSLDAVIARMVPVAKSVAKHQPVERDIAVIVNEQVTHAQLMKAIHTAPTEGLLRDVVLFDIYRPKADSTGGLAVGEKSLAVRLSLHSDEATLTEAMANAQDAKAQAERARSLQQQGFFSSAQLSQTLAAEASATARLQSARALVQLQNVRLSQTQVRAPDAGVISARQATVGSVVAAGTELFRLIRQGRIEWRAEVAAAELGRVQVGAPVQVTAASGQVLQGKVRMVAPSVDAQTRNALVYVDLPAQTGTAKAGMFAKGEIILGQSQALTVPQTAVVVRDGFSYLYTVGADNKVTQVKVQTGRLSGDRFEVLSGLKPDARLVASGGAFLNHGDTVRVVDATPAAASK